MRQTACSSHRQMKALFFILLLAGHDAVRVTEQAEWSKSKWSELHADCSLSLKGCSEGCVWKRFPLDKTPSESCRHTNAYLLENDGLENYHAMEAILVEKSQKYSESCQKANRWKPLEARKCARREVQLYEGLLFIIRASMNETFIAALDESAKNSLNDVMKKVLKNLANSQDEAESMAELIKKMKCQKSEFLQDPQKALAEVTGLSQALLSDNQTAKQEAKLQIEAMPESCRPISAEEEAEGLVKLKDLQKESEQERGETLLALDELEAEIDHVVEEEAKETESASSALQVSSSGTSKDALAMPPEFGNGLAFFVTLAAVLSTAATGVLPFVALAAIGLWVVGFVVCLRITDFAQEIRERKRDSCAKKVLSLPFKGLKALAKGAARLGKGVYKYFRKGKTSNTEDVAALFETEDVAAEQAEPLAIDEASVS